MALYLAEETNIESNSLSPDRQVSRDLGGEETQEVKILNGLLVDYEDDEIDQCVQTALKRRSRVRYKCMDAFSGLLAFGTSGGAIYLFRLKTVTHSSCSLCSVIPCDQGSIEVIRFMPNPQADDLLVVVGTNRGSLVVFRLTQLPGDQNPHSTEVYRAESFTQNQPIKFIEYDQGLMDPMGAQTKLYICDSANRIYSLETNNVFSARQKTLRLFYNVANGQPQLILSVNDSSINQISVHRSQLLISTDETSRFFNELSNKMNTIGKRKRRKGFFGACFFNPDHKPIRVLQMQANSNNSIQDSGGEALGGNMNQSRTNSQQTIYSSTGSLTDLENMLIFVARPSFRLWQVNSKCEVMFTHQFDTLIKNHDPLPVVKLRNTPLEDEPLLEADCHSDISEAFSNYGNNLDQSARKRPVKSDHFHKLIPIYSPTLGNLLLSHSEFELFIFDPIRARLIVWHQQDEPIVQVSCIENEIFLWSLYGSRTATNSDNIKEHQQQRQFYIRRLVLLAPTQFVLELHRIHRHLSLMSFVQLFEQQFRKTMTLPLGKNSSPISVEGGLLRNILLSAWDSTSETLSERTDIGEQVALFKQMVDEIVEESRQLKQSIENLSDSRFILNITNENIERLCSEPYTSLISLQVSLANLHTNHVIHFGQEALNRHKSMANLNSSIHNIARLKASQSSMQLNEPGIHKRLRSRNNDICDDEDLVEENEWTDEMLLDQEAAREVIVERHRPKVRNGQSSLASRSDKMNDPNVLADVKSLSAITTNKESDQISLFSAKGKEEAIRNREEQLEASQNGQTRETSADLVDFARCSHCRWPRDRLHLKPMHSSQQIQLNWLERNLLDNFAQNIDRIQEHALRHGIWHLFLKCLIRKNQLDQFIICCILLDDVRLLEGLDEMDLDQLVEPDEKSQFSNLDKQEKRNLLEEKLIDKLLNCLAKKDECAARYCLNCETEYDDDHGHNGGDEASLGGSTSHNDCSDAQSDQWKGETNEDDLIAFNLENLFEQLIVVKGIDVRRAVARLVKNCSSLKSCKISAKFYLKIIATATLNASQKTSMKSNATRLRRFQDAITYQPSVKDNQAYLILDK